MRLHKRMILWTQRKVVRTIGKAFVLLLWVSLILFCLTHREYISVERITIYTPGNIWLAIIIMLVLFAVKSVTFFIYVGILYAASGILFPLPVALLVNLCGTVIMSSLPYWIGKAEGKPMVAHIKAKYPKIAELESKRSENEVLLSAVARFVSILPSDPLSMYMGAVQVCYSKYLLGSLIGFLPDIVAFTIMGLSVSDICSAQFIIAVGAKIVLVTISIIFMIAHKRKSKRDCM